MFEVRESEETGDLNGDGDAVDEVVHVYDLVDGSYTNVGVSLDFSGRDVECVGDDLVLRDEFRRHLHVYHPDSDSVIDLRQNVHSWGFFGPLLLIWTRESIDQIDLNGDGDLSDHVVQVFDTRTDTLRNLGLAGSPEVANGNGNLLVFPVQESTQGEDLNGDGDLSDLVDHVHDLESGVTRNLGITAEQVVVTGHLAVLKLREATADRDLNGDGDLADRVLHLYDALTDRLLNLRISEREDHSTLVVDEIIHALRSEEQDGIDLNGDGDLADHVIQVLSPRTGQVHNTGVAFGRREFHLLTERIFGAASEAAQGADLNGDGDAEDHVLCEIDAATGEAFFLGLAGQVVRGDERALAFLVDEIQQDRTDFNADGDPFDRVVHVLDLETGNIVNCGMAVHYPASLVVRGHLVAFATNERKQGWSDLDGNGEVEGNVPFYYDLIRDRVTYFETRPRFQANHAGYFSIIGDYLLAGTRYPVLHDTVSYTTLDLGDGSTRTRLGDGSLMIRTSEPPGRDVNGDGETGHPIFGIARLRAPWEGNVNAGQGEITRILQVDGETKQATRPTGSPIEITLDEPPAGSGAYVLWAWASYPTGPFPIDAGPTRLGCTVLPTPLHAGDSPQPLACVRSPGLVRNPCGATRAIEGPAATPFTLSRNGFEQEITITLQALVEDAGASNDKGWSVSNAVTLQVRE